MTHAAPLILFLMLGWHAIADFPLQGEFLAKGKNRHTDLGVLWWPIALPAHAFIHGFGVALITGSVTLGVFEVVAHFMTDYTKCEGWISIEVDQILHIACKVLWCALFALGIKW